MNIQFINHKESDKDYIWQTYVQAMKPLISKIWGWDLNWQKVDFEKNLFKYDTYILKNNDDLLGYVQFKIESKRTYLNMIILEPEYQSKEIGPKIIAMIQSLNSNKSLELRCFLINQPAFVFYQRIGFEVIDSDDFFISMRLMKRD